MPSTGNIYGISFIMSFSMTCTQADLKRSQSQGWCDKDGGDPQAEPLSENISPFTSHSARRG